VFGNWKNQTPKQPEKRERTHIHPDSSGAGHDRVPAKTERDRTTKLSKNCGRCDMRRVRPVRER